MKFRDLNADEIDCRVAMVDKEKGEWFTALLYKNARCDMNILDETIGAEHWQREHYECKGNLFCRVGIKFNDEWIWKSDCGTESHAEKEKGEASDSFKRACFNWGIGRELYTAPLIFIKKKGTDGADNYDLDNKGNPKVNLKVGYIKIENGKIIGIDIENTRKRRSVFAWGKLYE